MATAVTPPDNIEVFVDNHPVMVPPGSTVLQVCLTALACL